VISASPLGAAMAAYQMVGRIHTTGVTPSRAGCLLKDKGCIQSCQRRVPPELISRRVRA